MALIWYKNEYDIQIRPAIPLFLLKSIKYLKGFRHLCLYFHYKLCLCQTLMVKTFSQSRHNIRYTLTEFLVCFCFKNRRRIIFILVIIYQISKFLQRLSARKNWSNFSKCTSSIITKHRLKMKWTWKDQPAS